MTERTSKAQPILSGFLHFANTMGSGIVRNWRIVRNSNQYVSLSHCIPIVLQSSLTAP
jgi:hypothetical protein